MQKKKIKTSGQIGERIKKRRKELGMSQEKLAEILGVTYQQIQRYENGTNRLNAENIQLVADALSMPVSHFFENGKTLFVREETAPYLHRDENRLLKYFQNIKGSSSKNLVLQVARLAAKGK